LLRYSAPMPVARASKRVPAHRGARALLGAVAAALLAGCSSSGTGATTTTAPSPATGGTSSTVVTTIPFTMAKNARQDVTTGSCQEAGGAWVLNGTVKNSAKTARNYQIVVDFVDPTGNTVLFTRIVTTPSIRPGASATWSATSISGLSGVACVIRQVQAPA
jgi:hypothetical protein